MVQYNKNAKYFQSILFNNLM